MFEELVVRVTSRVPDTIALYLFGSRARGDEQAESDVDLALLAPRPLDPVQRWKLQEELATLARADVDLVDLRRASAVLRVQVLRDATVLCDRDRYARELFEATALADYARLNEERRAILSDIRERGSIHG
jgi:predicted nucleotidyltransferase